MNCLTSVEALMISGTAALGASAATLGKVRDRILGRAEGSTALASYQRQADLLAELGHDAEQLLGEPPTVVISATSPAAPAPTMSDPVSFVAAVT
jgi:hypothetical protein